jgi:AcrR family transcriptional regulator
VLRALGEVFRAHGYEGASLTLITEATGLGKGSLYHLFPGGKEQMAAEVLADIDGWFELNIYAPLLEGCIAWFECRPHARHRAGDHVLFIGEIMTVERAHGRGLVFHHGHYGTTRPLDGDAEKT